MLFLALPFSDHCGGTIPPSPRRCPHPNPGICVSSSMWPKRLCRCSYLRHLGVERLSWNTWDCPSEPAMIITVLLKERRWGGDLRRRCDHGSGGRHEARGQGPGMRAASKSWKRQGNRSFPGTSYWTILEVWPSQFKIINTSCFKIFLLWSFVIAATGN